MLSHVQLFATFWTVACQAPLSMGFFRQEYWSGLLFSSPGDLSDSGIENASPVSPALQVDSLPTEPSEKPLTFPIHYLIYLLSLLLPARMGPPLQQGSLF